MKCPVCNSPRPGIWVSLPVSQIPGKLAFLVCLECAEKSSCYCKKHQRPHSGFVGDTTTACLMCIEEMVNANAAQAESLEKRLLASLPVPEMEELAEAALFSSEITNQTTSIAVLRFIATKALRTGRSLDDVVGTVIEQKSVDYILRLF